MAFPPNGTIADAVMRHTRHQDVRVQILRYRRKSMLRTSTVCLRRRSAWRDLLHPLSHKYRKQLWLHRDQTEMNEEVLRRPYYHLAPAEDPAAVEFRRNLEFADTVGPQLAEMSARATAFARSSANLRPKYPESAVSITPHDHMRTTSKVSN